MPRVMFINPESRRYPEIMRITNDFQTLLERSLRCLSELRPREPVLLLPTAPFRDSALKLLPRYGLSCREEHALTLSSGQAALAPELVRLLWARDRRIRPDAIFVGDDNVLSLLLPALLDWLGPEEAAAAVRAGLQGVDLRAFGRVMKKVDPDQLLENQKK